jgi:chemotaxis protein methyltransferase CheR
MTKKIPDAQLLQLGEVVARHLGLHFPQARWPDLERGVCGAAQECGYQHDLDGYVQQLLSPALTKKQLEVLASRLTVGETYFFREKRSLEIFERTIVPELIRARAGSGHAVRIWSAGCATGEEPYSLAIVLSKLAGLTDLKVEILATDLNSKSLLKASEGIYSEWSFRGTPPWIRRTYFEQVEKDCWAIAPAIKKMVTFSQLNLMDDSYPPVPNCPNGLDVIFCRNVLMYLTPEGIRKVVQQFYRCLATDGWLIVSPTETSQELFSEFATVSFGDVTFYRKSATGSPATLSFPVYSASSFSVQPPARMVEGGEPTRTVSSQASQQTSRENYLGESLPQSAVPQNAGPQTTLAPAVSYEQALALYEQGRYEEVERVLAALLSDHSSDHGNHAASVLLRARAYANQGKLAAALVLCDQAIAADKMAARAYFLRATILQEQGLLPEALLAFNQTVYAEPEFMMGHFALGSLALKQCRLPESEKHFANVRLLLARYEPEDVVPESDGLSAGRLREMIALHKGLKTMATEIGQPRIGEARLAQPRIRVSRGGGNLERSRT